MRPRSTHLRRGPAVPAKGRAEQHGENIGRRARGFMQDFTHHGSRYCCLRIASSRALPAPTPAASVVLVNLKMLPSTARISPAVKLPKQFPDAAQSMGSPLRRRAPCCSHPPAADSQCTSRRASAGEYCAEEQITHTHGHPTPISTSMTAGWNKCRGCPQQHTVPAAKFVVVLLQHGG